MPDAGAEDGLVESVVRINRTSKTVKGGRRFGFSTIVVVGDRQGRVGYGFGKANEVPGSVQKGLSAARRSLVRISIARGTIPYEVTGRFGASSVYMRPASPGTGVIASKSVRAVMEVLGVTDILTKCRGSTNPINVVKAVLAGLQSIRAPEEQMRLRNGGRS
ncbi:MAG: 30S ribosomal protein S5 [Planctomycetes bacterium]|nr:30S ribosomal protein S5 [Planctomycetota bacterium]